MLLFDVTSNFDKACESLLCNDPELLRFVKTHERRTLVLSKLCDEILDFERRYGNKATFGKRNEIVLTVARMFVDASKKAHEQKQWSEAERSRQLNKSTPYNEMSEICKDAGGKVFTNGVLTEVN